MNQTRSVGYYRVRSAVRFVFWASVSVLSVLGLSKVADAIDDSDENVCDVAVHFDFTWNSTTGEYIDVERCNHPRDVVLLQDGTWIWELAD